LLGELAIAYVGVLALALAVTAVGGGSLRAAALASTIVAVLVAVVERVRPFRAKWSQTHGDRGVDAAFIVVSVALGVAAELVPARALAPHGLWPSGWPMLAQVALAAMVSEAMQYGAHRAMHTVPWLWRFHSIHHLSQRLYWMNTLRNHPIDTIIATVIPVLALFALGAPEAPVAYYSALTAANAWLQHSNLRVASGPLNWIVSTPELHRLHHSIHPAERNGNYAGLLVLFDLVFGTYVDPTRHSPPTVLGVTQPAMPNRLWTLLAAPFNRSLWR
jgi:sterol desaturase/sphingolipid hydroxylase (fatty acid hydroxylase superfamily)